MRDLGRVALTAGTAASSSFQYHCHCESGCVLHYIGKASESLHQKLSLTPRWHAKSKQSSCSWTGHQSRSAVLLRIRFETRRFVLMPYFYSDTNEWSKEGQSYEWL